MTVIEETSKILFDFLSRFGSGSVLRRGDVSVTIRAYRQGDGSVVCGTREILDAQWPGGTVGAFDTHRPKDGDKLIFLGLVNTIERVSTTAINGVDIRHDMHLIP